MTTCPQCQKPVASDDKFCGHCGHALQRPSGPSNRRTEHAIDVVEVKYRLGMVYYKKNNLPAAIKLWREVLSINPQHQDARAMLKQVNAPEETDKEH